ncbi:hypothetical protein [Niabella ginsengisoli]|uniref:DUF1822 family protein n=1 Tax=Niabella ginsengisoli TaxID=522298 RepID=A0ABS9SG83_9BACT|nr:hypothetical protein [Niabella ginsengisoli]MCH5597365.1 hypothetical protein [Niabella ginsengisoli]
MQKITAALHQQCGYITDDIDKQAAVQNAYKRQIYAFVGAIRRLSVNEWYHPVQTGDKRIQNIKCSFYQYPVEIAFRVRKAALSFSIEIFVEIGKKQLRIDDFCRFDFLLERDHCYYQISPKSFDALDWFLTQCKLEWSTNETDELEIVLGKLDQWQVKIDRTEFTETETICVVPQVQVLLSELSNTFLKLEPQFVYDGIIVEGLFEPISKVEIANRIVNITRNEEKEKELVEFLQSLHEKFSNQNNGFFYLTFAEAQKRSWFFKSLS